MITLLFRLKERKTKVCCTTPMVVSNSLKVAWSWISSISNLLLIEKLIINFSGFSFVVSQVGHRKEKTIKSHHANSPDGGFGHQHLILGRFN